MKTVFSIESYSTVTLIGNMFEMVSNHNAGKAFISFDILIGYIKAFAAQYPSLGEGWTINSSTDELKLLDKTGKQMFIITAKEAITDQEMELLSKQHLS